MKFKKEKQKYLDDCAACGFLAASGAALIGVTFVHPVSPPTHPIILFITLMAGISLLVIAQAKYNAALAKFSLAGWKRICDKDYEKAMKEDDHT